MKGQKRVHILGSNLDLLTMQETLAHIEILIESRVPTQHVVINASKINIMQRDAMVQKIVNDSALINVDGQSIIWAARMLGYSIPERVTGIDLFQELVKKSEKKGWRVYYFGATEDVVRRVVAMHQKEYPNLKVAGFRSGYFDESESIKIAEEIKRSQTDVLFVAFSSPKKEIWIHNYQLIMQVPFAMGVGGSFDILAGKTKRAPEWMQKKGLEWLYRFLQEPKRMFRRYMIGNILFVKLTLQEKRKKKWS
ncbi:WecB/TagA/CpsF family glycosyltransferase [Listeria booriae]|uniref:WecB/TagA/CpsF family glycosyltransferase n=1 Tax=Listeria booriae TaxID=1552123 RepID=UPI001624FEE2|nr:WecB/TagA/CpsF family glycosyltransferase [Listeria booriae]MBC1576050.1 WecB/TagA/CpsF family glycosyltransferase [Listeria booriae]MBC2057998.1 WecB/TagA/CpsF family glycosyltransferase [Listeria booriae]MBC2069382.1 WecB/TagA/CpsF family glycosyltransferase [Listeria booriae]MBC2106578.1 WecB/TagA/CpsF family glycosyltransferase [Listeria booriae]